MTGAGTEDAEQLLLRLLVLVNVAVPPLTGFVIDKSGGRERVRRRERQHIHHQFFSSDSVAVALHLVCWS